VERAELEALVVVAGVMTAAFRLALQERSARLVAPMLATVVLAVLAVLAVTGVQQEPQACRVAKVPMATKPMG